MEENETRENEEDASDGQISSAVFVCKPANQGSAEGENDES